MKKPAVNLKKGNAYAVHTGTYAGELLILIDYNQTEYKFLSTPIMENRIIPKIMFDHARNTNIITLVECVPDYVLGVSTAQYKANEKSNT